MWTTRSVARQAIREIGYTDPGEAFNADGVKVIEFISKQSGDIAMGVDTGGAGDQESCSVMPGTDARFMPLPVHFAHSLANRISHHSARTVSARGCAPIRRRR